MVHKQGSGFMATDVFMDVDGLPSENIKVIADRLEARAQMDVFAEMRDRYFDLMKLEANAQLLELGGGTGIVGRAYARRPGFAGCYVVSDLSQSLIDFAREQAVAEQLDGLMDFKVADALTGSGLDGAAYDGVIIHTLLSHVPEPESVLRTASGTVHAGGVIAIFDADYASLQIVSGDEPLDQEVNAAIKAGAVAQPTVMRKVPQIASDLGLRRMHVRSDFLSEIGESEFFISLARAVTNLVVAQGILEQPTADRWLSALDSAIARDAFFGMCPYFTYLYRSP
jgi:ubiquinone/menaquinone biosynthesis C-methylase UbiE